MRKLIEQFLWVGALLLTLPSAWGFVQPGPIGNNGDAWQTITLGYGWADSVAPKDIYEGYRSVTPIQYYASDASFINYFGTIGLTNVDAAFAQMNGVMCGLTNTPLFLFSPTNGVTLATAWSPGGTALTVGAANTLDAYGANLLEFPLDTRQWNYTAQTLNLMDMKSAILQNVLLNLGLANPDRYVWTLHDRLLDPTVINPTCPLDEQYLVVQRNFDVNPAANYPYSPYINGSLFSFYIDENCGKNAGVPWSAITVPYAADALGNYSSVASGGLYGGAGGGGFFQEGLNAGALYTGLTRDDGAALKWQYSTNSVHWENTASGGGVLLVTNVQAPVQLTTLPLSLLLSQSGSTTDPNALLAAYPGLVILSVVTNFDVVVITTNIVTYFTNQSAPPVFSNTVAGGLPVVHSLTNIYYFTNQPGPTVINYENSDQSGPWTPIDTLDLATFVDAVAVDDPVTLQAAYPGLQILKTRAYPGYVNITNYVYYLTNQIGAPAGSPPILASLPVITNGFVTNWVYTFGNVFTNHVYTNRLVTVQTTWVTNLIGAPYPNVVSNTTSATYRTNKLSGDFFLIPTNWCGFDLILSKSSQAMSAAVTNSQSYGNFTNSAAGTNVTIYSATQSTFDTYTNYSYLVYPGLCEPVLAFGTNYTTNIVTTYQYYFGGIVTNHYYPATPSVVLLTNVAACPGGSPDLLCTNVSIVTNYLSRPSGDFYIVPSAWCDYAILSAIQTNVVYATNIVTATSGVVVGSTNSAGTTNGGLQYVQITITAFTNVTFLVQPSFCSQAAPVPALRRGIGRVEFIRANYDSLLGQFFQPQTNYYTMVRITNSQQVVEYYQRVVTSPDFLFQAADLTVPSAAYPYGPDARVIAPSFDTSAVRGNLAGPGTILPGGGAFIFNKTLNDLYLNGSLANYGLSTNSFLSSDNQVKFAAWGAFDVSTNYPVVFPSTASLASLMNQFLIQVTPSSAPDATNGVAYTVTFAATGGQPPYVWAAPNVATLVPGLSFNAATATLSGTPVSPGVFNFTLQLTDSVNRALSLNYTITIH